MTVTTNKRISGNLDGVMSLEGDGSLQLGGETLTSAQRASVRAGIGVATLDGRTIVLTGDSITAAHGGLSIATPAQSISGNYDSKGFFNWANVMLGHAFTVLGNSGIGSNTSRQIADRFTTDVVAYSPAWVQILAGTNDTSAADNTTANLQEMYEAAEANGIRVLALTIPPTQSTTAEKRQWHMTVNDWIVKYAADHPNIIVANLGQAWHDPATVWQPVSGYLPDGTHPGATAAVAGGRVIYEALKNIITGQGALGGRASTGSLNLLSNQLITGSGTSAPSGWSAIGSPAISYVDRTDGLPYKWCQLIVGSGVSSGMTSNVSIGASLAIGDTVEASIEFECEGLDAAAAANSQAVSLKLQCYNGSSFFSSNSDCYWDTGYSNVKYPVTKGAFRTRPHVIPATTTLIQMYLILRGSGTYRVGRAAIQKV